jgi:hypothetical protein
MYFCSRLALGRLTNSFCLSNRSFARSSAVIRS